MEYAETPIDFILRHRTITRPADDCMICLQPLRDEHCEGTVHLPCCRHIIGETCIESWLLTESAHGRCPHCRAALVDTECPVTHDDISSHERIVLRAPGLTELRRNAHRASLARQVRAFEQWTARRLTHLEVNFTGRSAERPLYRRGPFRLQALYETYDTHTSRLDHHVRRPVQLLEGGGPSPQWSANPYDVLGEAVLPLEGEFVSVRHDEEVESFLALTQQAFYSDEENVPPPSPRLRRPRLRGGAS